MEVLSYPQRKDVIPSPGQLTRLDLADHAFSYVGAYIEAFTPLIEPSATNRHRQTYTVIGGLATHNADQDSENYPIQTLFETDYTFNSIFVTPENIGSVALSYPEDFLGNRAPSQNYALAA